MPNLRKLSLFVFVAVFVLAFTPNRGWSQNVYGTIAGTVTDSSGGAVADTNLTLTNLDTAEARKLQSNSSGNYTLVNILPGRYRLEAEKPGFKKFIREPIVVQIESGLRVDVGLEVGEVSQTVEVSSEVALLQPETSSLGQVIESRSVTELPLNGRNPLALVALTAGVVPQGSPSQGNSSTGSPVGANPFAAGDFQIGGGQAGQSQILIDGVPTNGAYLNVVTVIPTQDAIEEFKVQTNNLGPEYGRFAGGVINLSTKSGTNAFHGSAYEFLRNKVLNANDFFSNAGGNPRPPFTQNQFGANGGGRIIKDKLFFFSSYEGFRQRKGSTLTTWAPTAAERSGDFSQIGSTGQSSVLPIYDPLTSTNCVSGGPACRTAFAGNKIPASRIDPTSAALLNYFPSPNQGGNPFGNFVESYSTGGNVDQINERGDYSMSSKSRLFGRYTRSHVLSLPDSPFNNVCSDRCTEDTVANQAGLGYTYTFSPNTVLDLHLGYTRYVYLRTPLSEGIDMSTFGPNWAALASQMTYTHIPTVCVSQTSGDDRWGAGSWCSQGTGSGIGAHDDTYSFEPMLSYVRGKHSFKFGGEYRLLRNNYYQSNDPAGFFQFDAGMTSDNPKTGVPGTASGIGFASFLLGYGSTTQGNSVTEPAQTADQNVYGAFYVNDTFQASRKLTINLGVRADLQGDWTERYNRIVVFNPNETSPIAGAAGTPNLKGAYDLVKSANHSDRTAFPSWNHVSPRIGLSYQVDQNTVVRLGYGIFYLPVDGRWNDAPHNLFINSINTNWLVAQADGVTPRTPLSNPFPGGISAPPGANQAFINVQGAGNEAPLNNYLAPYVQQWNFDIQRQLPGSALFDIAYAGSKGTHLPTHDQDLDQLTPGFLPTTSAQVAALTTLVPNPFYGVMQSGNISANPMVKAAQLLLPYPQFDDVHMAEPDNRDSIYHSMQLKVQKRFAAGAQILATYTVSKLIDNTNSEINWLEAASPSWGDSNAYNLRSARSLDGFDVPQRLVVASVLDLPIGRGRKYLSNMNKVANALIGGWGVDTIITFQNGFPVIIGGCPGALSSSGIPNVGCALSTRVGQEHMTSGSLDDKLAHWFDTSTFTAGSPTDYGYGNDSRTEPHLRTDGVKNFDFGFFKNTKFGPEDRIGLEFRAELFNAFNRVQFNPPNTNCCGGASFGQVTSQYNLPRVIQFALRTTF
ncbi:MAG TPA: TonB-dependent receptor [Bryobacteraceae bacterium]|nr:TonB-dependent receptor [Bryobacteraceae bacterium]